MELLAFSLPPSTSRPAFSESPGPLSVLLVTADRRLAGGLPDPAPGDLSFRHAASVAAALAELDRNGYHCVVFDCDGGEKVGLDGLEAIRERAPWSGIVVLTGRSTRDLSFEAMRLGAQECLPKSALDLRVLGYAIRYAVDRKWLEAFAERRDQLLDDAFRVIQPLVVIDGSGTIAVVNRAWERLAQESGLDPKSVVVGANYFRLLDEIAEASPEAAEVAAGVRAVLDRSRTHVQSELTFRTPDGPRSHHVQINPMLATGGVVITHTDITACRKAEGALRRSEQDLRRILDIFPENVGIHCDGRIVYANRELTRSLGFDAPEEVVGRPFLDIVHPDARDAAVEELHDFPNGSESSRAVERRWLRADGSILEVEETALCVRFDGADSVLVLGRDLEQRRQMTARMIQMDRMLSVGLMAAGIGHEINNPLSLVTANVDLALRKAVDLEAAVDSLPSLRIDPETLDLIYKLASDLKEVRESLFDARQGARRVQNIVHGLRAFARPDTDANGPVQIENVLQAALNMATNEIRHRARLIKDYAPVHAVVGNEARLGQVFLNIITNAAHAIPLGAAERNEIRVRVYPADNEVVVEISDTGSGIAQHDLPRIFEPFFTTKPLGQGTGLGLAICRNIVLSQGGSIEVESEAGRGTTFRVRLPAAIDRPRDRPVSSMTPLATPRHSLRVLVVDDEPLIGRVVRRCLGNHHSVTWAGSGREGIELLERGEEFDVVFLDVMMPDMTGIEVYERLAETAPNTIRRLVFLSGGAFTPGAREFLESIPNPQVSKPFEATLLRTVTEEVAAACKQP